MVMHSYAPKTIDATKFSDEHHRTGQQIADPANPRIRSGSIHKKLDACIRCGSLRAPTQAHRRVPMSADGQMD